MGKFQRIDTQESTMVGGSVDPSIGSFTFYYYRFCVQRKILSPVITFTHFLTKFSDLARITPDEAANDCAAYPEKISVEKIIEW